MNSRRGMMRCVTMGRMPGSSEGGGGGGVRRERDSGSTTAGDSSRRMLRTYMVVGGGQKADDKVDSGWVEVMAVTILGRRSWSCDRL